MWHRPKGRRYKSHTWLRIGAEKPSGFTMVAPRAREALNVRRETARRVFLHQQGEFLVATHQYEAVARQNLVLITLKP